MTCAISWDSVGDCVRHCKDEMHATYGDAEFAEDLDGYRCTCTSTTGVSTTDFYPEDNWKRPEAKNLCNAFCEGRESQAAELFLADSRICRCPAFDATPQCTEVSKKTVCAEENCHVACIIGGVDLENFEDGKCTCTGYEFPGEKNKTVDPNQSAR